jgi:hypothetical protein
MGCALFVWVYLTPNLIVTFWMSPTDAALSLSLFHARERHLSREQRVQVLLTRVVTTKL